MQIVKFKKIIGLLKWKKLSDNVKFIGELNVLKAQLTTKIIVNSLNKFKTNMLALVFFKLKL